MRPGGGAGSRTTERSHSNRLFNRRFSPVGSRTPAGAHGSSRDRYRGLRRLAPGYFPATLRVGAQTNPGFMFRDRFHVPRVMFRVAIFDRCDSFAVRAISAAVAQLPYTEWVGGSNP